MRLKYPRLSWKNDKRIKISDSDAKQIVKLHKKGATIMEIAIEFKVSKNTILRRINPKNYQKQLAKGRIRDRKKYAKDPKYRASQQNYVNKYIKNRRNTDEKFRKYHNELIKSNA